MTQTERREYLISALLKEQPKHGKIVIPASEQEQKRLLRSLFNIRLPPRGRPRLSGGAGCLFAGGNQAEGHYRYKGA